MCKGPGAGRSWVDPVKDAGLQWAKIRSKEKKLPAAQNPALLFLQITRVTLMKTLKLNGPMLEVTDS